MRRYSAGKRDAIEAELVRFWRSVGCGWLPLAPIEKGQPDGLLYKPGWMRLVEIKTGDEGRLSDDQIEWHRRYRGPAGSLVVARNLNEAKLIAGIK